jgi:hypothetical protein
MDRTTSILRLCRSCLRLQKQERQSGDYPRQGSQYERPRRANGVNARPGNRHEERIGSLGLDNYAIRIVIRDNLTGKIGSVTAPLTVD